MPSNEEVNEILLPEAINTALADYLHYSEQQTVIELFDTIEYNEPYNFKAQRKIT